MKLLSSATSPFGRLVKVLLHETGQYDSVEIISPATTPLAVDPIVQAANPAGKIPVLLRPDGPAIYDSRVICRYLDARAAAGLYPEAHLWEVLTLEATACAIIEAALLMVYEKRLRPDTQQSDAWIEAQWSKVTASVATLNSKWMSHLQGQFTMGHVAVGVALGYLDFRHSDRNWRADNTALALWYAAFSERPSMQATVPQE
ncbi:glutathione S-transferase [Cognatishimia sp. SS12]|uniref:glutathione S-transferase n=1 Tax=Cognatishimia sp. SS12 TaxID=2979465 RepID=UPI00232C94D0|nr:glutathione S-transferase [Cognatishimia sp. SS12]MDC0737650.1 glutathione S-transferase [Cognatishimia sp. SS12]